MGTPRAHAGREATTHQACCPLAVLLLFLLYLLCLLEATQAVKRSIPIICVRLTGAVYHPPYDYDKAQLFLKNLTRQLKLYAPMIRPSLRRIATGLASRLMTTPATGLMPP